MYNQQEDWTIDPETNRVNSSEIFLNLTNEVQMLIKDSAHSLIAGDTYGVARLIVAQLAHIHHLAPTNTESN